MIAWIPCNSCPGIETSSKTLHKDEIHAMINEIGGVNASNGKDTGKGGNDRVGSGSPAYSIERGFFGRPFL
jgi:hypothetical protein